MGKSSSKNSTEQYELLNWVLLRKLETFVFAFLFLALPFFAYKVIDTSTSALSVRNTTADLVQNLIKWKKTAADEQTVITFSSHSLNLGRGFTYEVRQDDRPLEEVILPPGVSMTGSVTFEPDGTAEEPSSFVIRKGARSARVEVSKNGFISAP